MDLKEAVSCFESMGFEVVVERNLHYVDMIRLLSSVVKGCHSTENICSVPLGDKIITRVWMKDSYTT